MRTDAPQIAHANASHSRALTSINSELTAIKAQCSSISKMMTEMGPIIGDINTSVTSLTSITTTKPDKGEAQPRTGPTFHKITMKHLAPISGETPQGLLNILKALVFDAMGSVGPFSPQMILEVKRVDTNSPWCCESRWQRQRRLPSSSNKNPSSPSPMTISRPRPTCYRNAEWVKHLLELVKLQP